MKLIMVRIVGRVRTTGIIENITSFVSINTTNEIIVAIFATIGNTSSRLNDCRPWTSVNSQLGIYSYLYSSLTSGPINIVA